MVQRNVVHVIKNMLWRACLVQSNFVQGSVAQETGTGHVVQEIVVRANVVQEMALCSDSRCQVTNTQRREILSQS